MTAASDDQINSGQLTDDEIAAIRARVYEGDDGCHQKGNDRCDLLVYVDFLQRRLNKLEAVAKLAREFESAFYENIREKSVRTNSKLESSRTGLIHGLRSLEGES